MRIVFFGTPEFAVPALDTLRRGGHDRVLLPTEYTRDRESLARDGVRGRLFVHEIVKLDLQLDAKGEVEAYRAKVNVSFKFED